MTTRVKLRAVDSRGQRLRPGQRVRLKDGRIAEVKGSSRGWEAEKVRKQVWARDGGICRNCGSTEDLWVCHAIPWSESPALRYDLRNLFLLCPRCDPDRNKEIVYRRYPWLRRPPGPQSAPGRPRSLWRSPVSPNAPLSRVLAVWAGQGLLVWLCVVAPLWALLAGHLALATPSSLETWVGSQVVATLGGIYGARALWRRRKRPNRRG